MIIVKRFMNVFKGNNKNSTDDRVRVQPWCVNYAGAQPQDDQVIYCGLTNT